MNFSTLYYMKKEILPFSLLHYLFTYVFANIDWILFFFQLMLLAYHKKSYLICDKITKLQIFEILCSIFFSSSCLCPVLAVSVLYFEKKIGNRLHEYSKIRNFVTYQITFLMTCQQHKSWLMLLACVIPHELDRVIIRVSILGH